MADSGALRVRRARAHKAGDHSLCRRCAAVRGEAAPTPRLLDGAAVDPLAELRQLAARLAAAYRDAPDNAMLARELRLTLQALMPQGGSTDGDLEDLFAEFGRLLGGPPRRRRAGRTWPRGSPRRRCCSGSARRWVLA